MSYMHERQYSRASGLATALDEQFLLQQHPELAGARPLGAESWAVQREALASLLSALAWAVRPSEGERPDPELLDELPSGLVMELRMRQRDGQPIADTLTHSAQLLRTGKSPLEREDGRLLIDIARRAEDEASDALRRLAEL